METLKPSVFSIIYGPTKSCPDPKREFFRSWIPLKPTEGLNGAPSICCRWGKSCGDRVIRAKDDQQILYFEWFMVGAAGFEPATSTV